MKPSPALRILGFALALLCSACAIPGHVLPTSDRAAYPEPPAAATLPELSQLSYNTMANRYLLPLYARLPPREIYCGCAFDPATRSVAPAACGFAPDKPWGDDDARGTRIEWEHVVPAARVVQALGCSSRAACRSNEAFRLAENDPYNLLPALGSLNARRSNRPYAELPGEPRAYGRCDFELEQHREQRQHLGRVEPPDDIKGDVARISLYYAQRHGLQLSDAEIQQFQAWSAQDPVSAEERYRAAYIRKRITGWANPFVE